MITEEMIIGGIVGAIITSLMAVIWGLLNKGFRTYRLWSIKDDIETLRFVRKHVEEIKRSSVALNRGAFSSLFAIFILIGLAHLLQIWGGLLKVPMEIREGLVTGCWLLVITVGITGFKRYGMHANYQKAIEKIDQKLAKLEVKSATLSNSKSQ